MPFLGLEPSDLLWFFKVILLLLFQWRIQARGPGTPAPPLFLDQTEARGEGPNTMLLDRPPPPPPPPYLEVKTHHYLPICESRSA